MPKYVYDDYGQKYEGMSRDEILETIGMGEARENVFTGNVTYNDEVIPYDYNGTIPSDALLVKLLNQSLNFETLYLTQQETASIIAMAEFKIHFFLCECEVYVTNGHCDRIAIYNTKLGFIELYVSSQDKRYYMRSNSKINNIYWCSREEYDDIVKDTDTIYVVEEEDYTAPLALNAERLGGILPSGYVKKTGDESIDGVKTFTGNVVANTVRPSVTDGGKLGTNTNRYDNAYIHNLNRVDSINSNSTTANIGSSQSFFGNAYINDIYSTNISANRLLASGENKEIGSSVVPFNSSYILNGYFQNIEFENQSPMSLVYESETESTTANLGNSSRGILFVILTPKSGVTLEDYLSVGCTIYNVGTGTYRTPIIDVIVSTGRYHSIHVTHEALGGRTNTILEVTMLDGLPSDYYIDKVYLLPMI